MRVEPCSGEPHSQGHTEGRGGFRCLWSLGFGGAAERPDRLGVVFAAVDGDLGFAVLAHEKRPNALAEPRARKAAEVIAEDVPFLIVNEGPAPGFTMLTLVRPAPARLRRPRTRGSLAARAARRHGRRR